MQEAEIMEYEEIYGKTDDIDYKKIYGDMWKKGPMLWVRKTMRKRVKFVLNSFKDKSIKLLDVGCGEGFLTQFFPNAVGVDVSLEAWKIAKKQGLKNKFVCHDITKQPWPFKDSEFEAAICTEVLEHLKPEHVEIVLAEIKRVVKPNGKIVITTPNPIKKTVKVKIRGKGYLLIDMTHAIDPYHINEMPVKTLSKVINKYFTDKKHNMIIDNFGVKLSGWIPIPKILQTVVCNNRK